MGKLIVFALLSLAAYATYTNASPVKDSSMVDSVTMVESEAMVESKAMLESEIYDDKQSFTLV